MLTRRPLPHKRPGLRGQVAQLVEQGIENPRVGGSIPSLATFLLLVVSGCGTDPCRGLCLDVALALDECREGWGTTWEDLGAASRRDFRTTCQEDWDATRADLEARQLPAAEEECSAGKAELATMTCDDLRALYL